MTFAHIFGIVLVLLSSVIAYAAHKLFVATRRNPLHRLPGPPINGLFGNHLRAVLDPSLSARIHHSWVQKYGRSIRIRGVGPWDERLLTLDPVSVAHVLKNSATYEKPWQSRRLITSLIGCGMLAAEGQTHRRHRRVATPAFSIQNLRALVPVVFRKGIELKERWHGLVSCKQNSSSVLDVYHWISRATFDVIGLAGFDYNFNAIQDESNELFIAYKEMFEVAISQGRMFRTMLGIYLPSINSLFPDNTVLTVRRCQQVIRKVAGQLIREKKRKIATGEHSLSSRDLLSLLLRSNIAADLPVEQRISDEDILHNVNTFMFAGSDTSSLSITWTLLLLAERPDIQDRLRKEMFSVAPPPENILSLTEEEIQSLYTMLSDLPYLHNVVRESLRLVPPVHSSIRVATQDDEVPIMYPVPDGKTGELKRSVSIAKGSFVHVAVEGFNLDKEFWGDDAWEFNPDRWDNLPEEASKLPGLFANMLTFSAGPRSCIGMRFSMIEIKSFLYILLTNFVFDTTGQKIFKANVVLTRPYLSGQYKTGSQCPLVVKPYTHS